MVGVVAELVARVDAAFDELASIDIEALEPSEVNELVVEAHRLRARAEHASTTASVAFERGGDPGSAANTGIWLAHRCRIPKPQAKREVLNGRTLREMPHVAAAFASGAISEAHVSLLGKAQRFHREAFAKFEEELLDDALRFTFAQLRRRVRYFEQTADPDQAEKDAQDVEERRRAHLSQTFEDTWQLDALFDPLSGETFADELERLEKELFEEDWAEARARVGPNACAGDLRRTPAQRRLDALTLMATRSATLGNTDLARPLISVFVSYETFAGPICQLASGTVLTPGQVAAMITDADIERVVFGPDSRVIDLGRRSRLFRGGARRAVQVRDLECTDDLCDEPIKHCDVDHIQRWEHGGPTDHDNGRLRCPQHNPGRRRPKRRNPPDDAPPR